MKLWVTILWPDGVSNSRPPTHMGKHASERQTTQLNELIRPTYTIRMFMVIYDFYNNNKNTYFHCLTWITMLIGLNCGYCRDLLNKSSNSHQTDTGNGRNGLSKLAEVFTLLSGIACVNAVQSLHTLSHWIVEILQLRGRTHKILQYICQMYRNTS